jgi:hypothetical protein
MIGRHRPPEPPANGGHGCCNVARIRPAGKLQRPTSDASRSVSIFRSFSAIGKPTEVGSDYQLQFFSAASTEPL